MAQGIQAKVAHQRQGVLEVRVTRHRLQVVANRVSHLGRHRAGVPLDPGPRGLR